MNFQTVLTAQKLPTSDGLTGGYLPGGNVPGPLLVRALNYINTKVGEMVAEIRAQGLAGSTAIIISAKHGQSPTDHRPGPRPGRPDHLRHQRGLDRGPPGRRRPGHLLDGRRRHAAVAE